MKKQGFRFFILRVLAHRLQNLADFVSRQVVEEERPVLWEQANRGSADTGSGFDASRVVSSPESELAGADAENPAAHWLTQGGTAEPPADWLARVRKAAPELLKQKGFTSRNAESQSLTRPAAEVGGNAHLTDAGAEHGTVLAETVQVEEDTWMSAVPGIRVEDLQRRDATHVPASSQNIATHSQKLPSTSIIANVPVTDAGMEQRIRLTEIIQAETASSDLTAPGKLEREEDARQEYKTDVPASLNSVLKKHAVERIEQKSEPARNSTQGIASTLAPIGEWLSEPVKRGSSPWEDRPGISANQQFGYSVWSSAGISEAAYGQRWPRLSEAGEHKQVEMRWPSLPEDVSTDGQDWEMARRAWERQQRLDEEQRGNSWNA